MAYEDMTYEAILKRMMDRVLLDYPNLDNREGSIIFNALAPAAIELAIMYTELDNVLRESFVDTASREYILIACKQMGIDTSVFEAKAGVHKGAFNVEVPIGSRWSCELYNYTVIESIGIEDGNYTYRMECDTVGTAPNNQTGDLMPITDMPDGLTYSKLIGCLVEGENETEDEVIRTTYYNYLNNSITDGNIAQYKQWCSEYDGIGAHKIFPLWNGANTVKVSILSSSNKAATDELIAEFQEYLDPGTTGMGDGEAPIGAFVTVTTATEIPINVSATVALKQGYSSADHIAAALDTYFSEIAYSTNIVSYMSVGARILACDGIETINGLLVNDGTDDIILGDEEIPVIGSTNWTVG